MALDPLKLPRHVAIIMDGNGRWAKRRGIGRISGHEQGAEAVREIVRTSREIGIGWLTLYAFSEENWKRSKIEVRSLMGLLKRFLKTELEEMQLNGIRLQAIGRTERLPPDTREVLDDTVRQTQNNTGMVLTLALSYGGRQEILEAVRRLCRQCQENRLTAADIDAETFGAALYTAGMPDPDLLIRTSAEYRVSNFLLWQIAYTEFYITPTLWPDFRRDEYIQALEDFQKRERRFGAAGE